MADTTALPTETVGLRAGAQPDGWDAGIERSGASSSAWQCLVLLGYVALVASFFILRAGGRWAENDTATIALVIRSVADEGALIPPHGHVYFSGYGYPALGATLLAF